MKMKPMPRPPTPRRVPRRMVKTLRARTATDEKDFEEYEGESEPNMKFSHALIVVLLLHVLAVGGVFAFNALKSRHIVPDRSKPAAGQAAAPAPETAAAPANKAAAPANKAAAPAHEAAPAKAPAKAQQADAAATHTVVAGDTLKHIATGNKTTVEAIEQANGLVSGSTLRVGQVLKIPAKAGAPKAPAKQETPAAKTAEVKPAATAAKNPEAKPAPVVKTKETAAATKPADSEPANPAASDKSYTVAKGDNPYAIAKKLKVKYNDLIKANDIKDPTKLQIGQKLIIP